MMVDIEVMSFLNLLFHFFSYIPLKLVIKLKD